MKRLLVNLLALSLILASSYGASAQRLLEPGFRRAVKEIDALFGAEYDKYLLAGITVGVVYRSRLIWTKSYGYADVERRVRASSDTVYRIGSITKMFTALMLLQLVKEGKAHLSDPVEKYLPEVNRVQGRFPGAPPITLVQLATHTSGLATEPDDVEKYTKGPVADWEKVLIEALAQTKYAFEPGTRYNYSNIGYAILGAALARAAGQPYTDYIQRRIFAPLGMTRSTFELKDRTGPELARGYFVENAYLDTTTPEREHQGRGYKVPNGGIYSTVEDMARLLAFELGEGPLDVLSPAALADNFQLGARMNQNLTSGYGLGFAVYRKGNIVMFGHGGSVAGYESGLLFNRDARVGIIVLRNLSGDAFTNMGDLCMKAIEILYRARRNRPK